VPRKITVGALLGKNKEKIILTHTFIYSINVSEIRLPNGGCLNKIKDIYIIICRQNTNNIVIQNIGSTARSRTSRNNSIIDFK